ncbi:MAG: hypothetical protein ACJAZS_000036 [Alteromonas naphthalenivorans]|jgi:hypothetical protein
MKKQLFLILMLSVSLNAADSPEVQSDSDGETILIFSKKEMYDMRTSEQAIIALQAAKGQIGKEKKSQQCGMLILSSDGEFMRIDHKQDEQKKPEKKDLGQQVDDDIDAVVNAVSNAIEGALDTVDDALDSVVTGAEKALDWLIG